MGRNKTAAVWKEKLWLFGKNEKQLLSEMKWNAPFFWCKIKTVIPQFNTILGQMDQSKSHLLDFLRLRFVKIIKISYVSHVACAIYDYY